MHRILTAAALCAVLSLPAFAQEAKSNPAPGAVKINTLLLDLTGKPFTECVQADAANPAACKDIEPVTLGRLVLEIENSPLPSDQKPCAGASEIDTCLSAPLIRDKIARAAQTDGVFTSSEVAQIEGRLASFNLPATELAAAIKLLDPALAAKY